MRTPGIDPRIRPSLSRFRALPGVVALGSGAVVLALLSSPASAVQRPAPPARAVAPPADVAVPPGTATALAARSAPALVVVPGPASVVARWTGPTRAVGRVSSYTLEIRRRTGSIVTSWRSIPVAAATRHLVVAHLANGGLYQVRVRARSGGLDGPWSVLHEVVAGAPGPVTGLEIWPGDHRAVLAWRKAAATNGAALRAYRVGIRVYRPSTRSWSAISWRTRTGPTDPFESLNDPWSVQGLRNGVTYEVRLLAVNSRGPGVVVSRRVTPHVLGLQGAVRLLTAGEGGLRVPKGDFVGEATLSPDGTKVAFVLYEAPLVAADTNGTADVYLTDIATGHVSLVSATASGQAGNGDSDRPVWSPDSTRIAFRSSAGDLAPDQDGAIEDVFVRTVATGSVVLIDDGTVGSTDDFARPVAFAQGGASLVVFRSAVTDAGDDSRTVLVDLGTGTITRLPDMETPNVSPDGGTIAYMSSLENPRAVLYDIASGVSTDIGPGTDEGGGPTTSWSPDGRYLAITQWGGGAIVRQMSSGGTTRRLPGAARIDTMSWSPNGRWLSYLDDDGEPPSHTLTLDLRTWKAAPACVPVSTLLADSDECFPSWSPDSTRLLLDGESAAFVPGAWGYAGPVLLTVATGRYTVPLSTSGGALPEMRTMDDEYMAGMTWIDAHHLLVQTDAALVPGDTGGGDDLYVKTIP